MQLTEQPHLTTIIQKRTLMLFGYLVKNRRVSRSRRILTRFPRVIGEG